MEQKAPSVLSVFLFFIWKGAARRAPSHAGDETLSELLVTEAGSVFQVVIFQRLFCSCTMQGDARSPAQRGCSGHAEGGAA